MHEPFYYALATAMTFYSLHLLVQFAIGLIHFGGKDPNEIAD